MYDFLKALRIRHSACDHGKYGALAMEKIARNIAFCGAFRFCICDIITMCRRGAKA
jgi:hypothetical protein